MPPFASDKASQGNSPARAGAFPAQAGGPVLFLGEFSRRWVSSCSNFLGQQASSTKVGYNMSDKIVRQFNLTIKL